MGFSAFHKTVILVVLSATCVVGTGPCKPEYVNAADKNFKFENLVGKWYYAVVPKESLFDNVKSATVNFAGSGKTYNVEIINILKDGKSEKFTDTTLTYQGHGVAVSHSTTKSTPTPTDYKYYYLGQGTDWVYYVVCTEKGGDSSLDLRNVITKRKLSDDELKGIMTKENHFVGATMKLFVP